MNRIRKIIKFLLKFNFLPFYLIGKLLKSKKNKFIKIIGTIPLVLFFLPIWYGILLIVFFIIITNTIGYPVEIIGNSMRPSLISHSYIKMYSYPGLFGLRKLQMGDIITFTDNNEADPSKSLVKRVIALPGETFEIRDQVVYVNNKILDEPYIASPKSTYGGVKISECKTIKIPKNKILALGDNRKLSRDSREIGLISISDVDRVIPYNDQKSFSFRWRDISKDREIIDESNLNTQKYLEFLNIKREEKNLKPLKLNEKLSQSAELRAKAMLQYDDITWQATKSGYTMSKSMSDAGYYNVVYGEYPLLGYYTANELIAYEKEYASVINFFMNRDYQDIGISSYKGELNGCPTHIVVQQVAGYVPPNYNLEDLEGWKKTLLNLREILPSWNTIKDYSLTYNNNKKDTDRLLEIINYRIGMIEKIVYKMENKQWLNNEENVYIRQELKLFNEQESIAKKLNSFRWQH